MSRTILILFMRYLILLVLIGLTIATYSQTSWMYQTGYGKPFLEFNGQSNYFFSSLYFSKNKRWYFGLETDFLVEEERVNIYRNPFLLQEDVILAQVYGYRGPFLDNLNWDDYPGLRKLDSYESSYTRIQFNPSVMWQAVTTEEKGIGIQLWIGPGLSYESLKSNNSGSQELVLDDRINVSEGQPIYLPYWEYLRGVDFQIRAGVKAYYETQGWQFGATINLSNYYDLSAYPINHSLLIGKKF